MLKIKLKEIKFKIQYILNLLKSLPKAIELIMQHSSFYHSCPLDLAIDNNGKFLELIRFEKLEDGQRKYYRDLLSGCIFSVRD